MGMKRKGFYNKYIIKENLVIIYVKDKKNKIFEIYIDKNDLQKFIDLDYPICVVYRKKINGYYAVCTHYVGKVNGVNRTKSYYLHRIITNAKKEDMVDHINHNGLDNRNKNLILTTNSINSQNRKKCNKNNNTGVLNLSYIESSNEYWIQMTKNEKKYKWIFPIDKFEEAKEFAINKRKELFTEIQ